MQVIVKISAANGKSEFVATEMGELGRITGSLDKIGTDYSLEFVSEGGADE